MAEGELDLFQRRFAVVRQARESSPQVVRRDSESEERGVVADDEVDGLGG